LHELLAEGAHLIGAGLLNLLKAQEGRVVPTEVIALMGTLLAARDFVRRHPGALLVSTDSQLARTWLRLGTQGERCDLLGVYESDDRLVVECIEVKTTKGAPRGATDEKIVGACLQVAATLAAVREGLGDMASAEQSGRFLAAPRNEMLKEVLVQGCMGRFASEDERSRWAGWLARLFGPTPELPELHGTVMDVALGSAEYKPEESIVAEGVAVRLRHLNEADVERLLEPPGDKPQDEDATGGSGSTPDPPHGDEPSGTVTRRSQAENAAAETAAPNAVSDSSAAPTKSGNDAERAENVDATAARMEPSWAVTLGVTKEVQPVTWPPSIRGNPHLMIVGLPGMGKTTCLINLCRQLQAGGIAPIVFSYHDDIDEKLTAHFPHVASHDCHKLGFNPMHIVEPQPRAHAESAGQLRDIFAAIFPELGDLQLEELRGAIKQSYESAGWGGAGVPAQAPEFAAFLALLRSLKKPDKGMKTLLARLTELDDFGFFAAAEGEASLLDSTKPQIIRIHAVANEVVQRAYASFVLYRIYQDMFRRGRQERLTHAVVFDEAHRASRLKLLPTMAKECRKYGLALIVASQEARDFDSGLFAAIANYLVLRVTDADARAMARNVAPSDQERRLADRLKNLPKFEALFFAEGQRLPAAVRLAAG
jgi:DNA polymerase III delta prime subunit